MRTETELGSDGLRPLSHQQMLMWTGQHLDPEIPIYNMAFRIEIADAIDADLFEKSFQILVNHSETHRCTIQMVQGIPYLKVNEQIEVSVQRLDFSGQPNPQNAIIEWCDERCKTRFDLSERLFDIALLKQSESAYVWYIAHHHVISDAWAVSQLVRLHSEIYQQLKAGAANPRAEIPFEFSTAKTTTASSPPASSAVEFYGPLPNRILAPSSRITVIQSGDKASQKLDQIFSAPQARSFSTELAQFNVGLTLLFAYLHLVSGQEEVSVGAPFHNRLTPDTKSTLGMFIDIRPIRVHIEKNETFLSLFKKTQLATNKYLRSAMAQEPAKPTNSTFNVIYNFINAKFDDFNGASTDVHWLHAGASDRQHHYRMHFENFQAGQSPDVKVDFNHDVFDDQQKARSQSHFRAIVDAMANDWECTLHSIDLLTDEETECYRSLNSDDGQNDSRHSQSVLEQFEKIVSTHPDSIALRCGDESMSFGQLADRINHVCDQIAQTASDGTQQRGLIVLNRSSEAVIAIMSALKSGVAFIPVDPQWPKKRIEFIANNSEASLWFGTAASNDQLNHLTRINVDRPDGPSEANTTLDRAPRSDSDTAYILYTSGSTGKPKGVEISYWALDHYAGWATDFYTSGSPASFPLFTPLTFDLTITSIFVPLMSGGTVVVYPESHDASDVALLNVIEDDLVDVIKLTPSHLSLLHGRDLSQSRVKQLIVGGESFRSDVARQAFNQFPSSLLIHNEYGPTEATVGCVVQTIDSQSPLSTSNTVPIGKPIHEMHAYVLNANLRQQPIGVPGELYMAGAGLANGYFANSELTQTAFIDGSAFGHDRIYRTGDIVRLNHQGGLEYLGRVDHQVKIRGARIEIPGIESALLEHHQIQQVTVGTFNHAGAKGQIEYCVRCGLASNYPDVEFNADLVCDQCQAFESYRDKAAGYFKSMPELMQLMHSASREASEYDCIALLSGGKDSSYMLARLAELDLRILAFTLDNGYISDEAKSNIRRVVEALGVDHYFGQTPHMDEIFVDSLKRHANVCQGCFKTIYTLSVNVAKQKNIPFIVTGLSRGQFFETRLTEDLFRSGEDTLIQIDNTVLEARKAYHRVDDAVGRLLDVDAFQSDSIFEQVQFVDFYRYCDVELDEMLDYLNHKLPWVRPTDTGRSTNCLINDVGIYVHKKNRGFHNYALPYSWDVRMGHKQRDAALDELDDSIDVDQVHRILAEIGYDGPLENDESGERLVAYYSGPSEIPLPELQSHLRDRLPEYMLPSRYVYLESIPVTTNGKVDLSRLPDPTRQTYSLESYVAPQGATEETLAKIWSDILQRPKVGTRDNFFDLGGDSILAIQIVARANRAGLKIKPSHLFENQTIQSLANAWLNEKAEIQQAYDATAQLSPIQHWAISHQTDKQEYWNQSAEWPLPAGDLAQVLTLSNQTIQTLIRHHKVLRTKINHDGSLEVTPPDEILAASIEAVSLDGLSDEQADAREMETLQRLNEAVSLNGNATLRGALFHRQDQPKLLLVVNHMAIDAVSWLQLQDDFEAIYRSENLEPSILESGPTFGHFTQQLTEATNLKRFTEQASYWRDTLSVGPPQISNRQAKVVTVSEHAEPIPHYDSLETTLALPASTNAAKSDSGLTMEQRILTALSWAIADVSRQNEFRLFIERHGRSLESSFDYSRAIGWFTSLSPTRFCLTDPNEQESSVSELLQCLASVPEYGIGYGVLRYLHPDTNMRESLKTSGPEVVVNYLGQLSSSKDQREFRMSRPIQLHRSSSLKRFAALEISLWTQDELVVHWEFDRDQFGMPEIEALADQFAIRFDSVNSAQSVCSKPLVAKKSFSMTDLNTGQLDQLAAILNKKPSDRGETK